MLQLVLVTLLCACASTAHRDDASRERAKMGRMGRTPLSDFNFGKDNIPAILLQAVDNTYGVPLPLDCATLVGEISALDAMLGPDLDRLRAAERRDSTASSVFVGAIRSLIPYRAVIRFVSGAKKRERRIAEAIAAGGVRRGYLKGLGEARGCAYPAAPIRAGGDREANAEEQPPTP